MHVLWSDHSTCMCYDHSTCMFYDHSACMYCDHSDRASDRASERSSDRASDRAIEQSSNRASERSIERSSDRSSDHEKLITRAPDGLLTRWLVRWVRFFKTKLSSILMRLNSVQITLFYISAKPSTITKTRLFNKNCPRKDINKKDKPCFFSQKVPPRGHQQNDKPLFL